MDPKAKAKLEKDMAKLRKQMKDLGKQLEDQCGMKDFDPLRNMNPHYPFNILPEKDSKTDKSNPFGPGFPFNHSNVEFKNKNNPFGPGFPFNHSQNDNFRGFGIPMGNPFASQRFDGMGSEPGSRGDDSKPTKKADEAEAELFHENIASEPRICVIDSDDESEVWSDLDMPKARKNDYEYCKKK